MYEARISVLRAILNNTGKITSIDNNTCLENANNCNRTSISEINRALAKHKSEYCLIKKKVKTKTTNKEYSIYIPRNDKAIMILRKYLGLLIIANKQNIYYEKLVNDEVVKFGDDSTSSGTKSG